MSTCKTVFWLQNIVVFVQVNVQDIVFDLVRDQEVACSNHVTPTKMGNLVKKRAKLPLFFYKSGQGTITIFVKVSDFSVKNTFFKCHYNPKKLVEY